MNELHVFKAEYDKSVDQEAQFIVSEILDCADRECYQREVYFDDVLRKARRIFEEMND